LRHHAWLPTRALCDDDQRILREFMDANHGATIDAALPILAAAVDRAQRGGFDSDDLAIALWSFGTALRMAGVSAERMVVVLRPVIHRLPATLEPQAREWALEAYRPPPPPGDAGHN
jgi:hypothetical protein